MISSIRLDGSTACMTLEGTTDTESFRAYLLGTQFDAWHGFLRTPADWSPVIRAVWVCVLYIALPLAAAYTVFLRRDVAGD